MLALTAILLYNRNMVLQQAGWIVEAQTQLALADQLWPPSSAMSDKYSRWLLGAASLLVRSQDTQPDVSNLATRIRQTEAAVKKRVAVVQHNIDETHRAQAEWAAALQDVNGDPRFKGKLREIEGLVPLRKNPQTLLWEFWHVQSGTRPQLTGERFRIDGESGIVLVLLPAGTFRMGSPREDARAADDERGPDGSQLEVEIREPFFVAAHEMTQGQFFRAMGYNPSFYSRDSGDVLFKDFDSSYPVDQITFPEAADACMRFGLELPTEEEWEYFARAGEQGRWWAGNEEADVAGAGNTADRSHDKHNRPPDPGLGPSSPGIDDGYEHTAPVGSFKPNPWGIFDTIGNLWEWTRTSYARYGGKPPSSDVFVIRGGSWGSSPWFARSATRNRYQGRFRFYSDGFRAIKHLD
jgi:formylglycine-generating enzyme required for sulfatase activity